MKEQKSAVFFAFISGLAWSFTGLFSRLVSWNPFTLVGLRAPIALLIIGLGRGSFRIRPNKGLWVSAAGITLTSLMFMAANRLTTAANAIVLQYTASIFVMLYSFFVKKQKPLKSEVIAAFFVFFGVILCFMGGLSGGGLIGDCIALLSGITFAMVFLAARYSGNSPIDGVYFGTLVSCVFVLAVPFDPAFQLTVTQLLVMLALGLGLGLGYLFFSMGMQRGLSPVKACIISNVEPVLNPTWVALLLGQSPGLFSILGAVTVLLAITLQSLYEMRRNT